MKNNDIKLQTTEKPNRYPGTRPFEEKDRSLFFGRNEDISRLSKQIRLEPLLVLFGKSGLGKSSLLNAGILPAMKESGNVLPISIRLGFSTADNENAATVFLNKIAPQLSFNNALWNKLATDYRETWKNDSTDECFWLAAKSLQLQHKGKTILLVLDQFEELFSYSEQAVKRFGFLLSTLLFGEMPQSFQNLLIDKLNHNENLFEPDEIDALYEKTNVKIVISIRSDRMSLLNRLKTHIPQILQKTFELQPLNIAQAKEAMLKPASAEGDFASPKFEYENAAENLIINYLSENTQERIETFQLQLICQFCENLIIKNYPNPTSLQKAGRVEVKTTDIGDLATIFSRHYDNLINDITDSTQRLAVQKLIEENLIIDNNRVPLPDRVIISKHHISSQLLQQLVNSRLLRSEPNNVGGFSYEISHDTLIEPITKSFKIRFEKEEKERKQHQEQERLNKLLIERKRQRTIIYIVSVAAVVAIALAVFGLWQMNKAEKQTEIAEKQTKIATQKEKEAKESLEKLKSSEFNRITSEANQFLEKREFADAVQKLKEAFKWANDSIVLQQRIDSLMKIAGKEIEYKMLMTQAAELERTEPNYHKAIELYAQAAQLNFNNAEALSKKNALQAKFNSRLLFYQTQANEYLNRGSSYKEHAWANFIEPGLKLKPDDAILLELKKKAGR